MTATGEAYTFLQRRFRDGRRVRMPSGFFGHPKGKVNIQYHLPRVPTKPGYRSPARAALWAACVVLLSVPAAAQDPGSGSPWRVPRGLTAETADLTVRGSIGPDSPVYLDAASVRSLPSRTFTCVDPWDNRVHSFTGVLLSDLLARLGVSPSASRITVTARNKYAIPIRRGDYERYEFLLAWAVDGLPIEENPAMKNRRPFCIAIDFARFPELDPSILKHQLVWQVNEILVE